MKGSARELKADLSIIVLTLRKAFSEEDVLAAVHRALADYNKETDAKAEQVLEEIREAIKAAEAVKEDREEIPDEILEATLKAIAEAMPDEDEGWADNG